MIPKANFHTHTTYCDGKESAESMVLAAIAKGFTALGFSGHCYTDFDESYCMKKEQIPNYIAEIQALQEKYADTIKIYAGVEQDIFSKESIAPFAYAIGSVHYVKKDGLYLCVDEAEEVTKRAIASGFDGDCYAFAEEYFQTVGEVIAKTGADIIGHFDLLTKFNGKGQLFDTTHSRYQKAAEEAIVTLVASGKPFEINTGAMYKGLQTEPYPSFALLKQIKKHGGNIMLSSDSHDGNSLGFGFLELAKIVKEIGFSSSLIWTPTGFEEVEL